MTKRTTAIILDRLAAALGMHNVKLARGQLLETAAVAFGYRNTHEFTQAVRAGEIAPAPVEPIGTVAIGGDRLVVLRDTAAGMAYAVEEGFLDQTQGERREAFGPSPYGGIVDLRQVASHPATAWIAADPTEIPPTIDATRYHAYGADGGELLATDDLEAAKKACEYVDGRTDLDTHIIDVADRTIMRAHYCWRPEALPPTDASPAGATRSAADLFIAHDRIEDLKREVDGLVRSGPDWRSWDRDLKKASHKRQEPIDDEMLIRLRHAVADNHTKSSESERSTVRYREQRYVERHLGGLLARLDRAEQALADAGLAPAEIARKPKEDAAETLAAIEAVKGKRAGTVVPNMYEVEASRDGDTCRAFFQVANDEDKDEKAAAIVAKAFRMDLDDFRDDDGFDSDAFEAECDSMHVYPVKVGETEAIVSDALALLSHSGIEYGYDHPVRIKLLAALASLRPKIDA